MLSTFSSRLPTKCHNSSNGPAHNIDSIVIIQYNYIIIIMYYSNSTNVILASVMYMEEAQQPSLYCCLMSRSHRKAIVRRLDVIATYVLRLGIVKVCQNWSVMYNAIEMGLVLVLAHVWRICVEQVVIIYVSWSGESLRYLGCVELGSLLSLVSYVVTDVILFLATVTMEPLEWLGVSNPYIFGHDAKKS